MQLRATIQTQLLLLEGVCGAGKTTVCSALRNFDCGREILVLDQHFTYAPLVPFEDAGTLTDAQNFDFLQDRIHSLKELTLSPCERSRIIVLDSFHITQRCRPGVLSDDSFRRIDESLGRLRCRLVFLWIDDETLMQRTVLGRRNTGFARYAQKFG